MSIERCTPSDTTGSQMTVFLRDMSHYDSDTSLSGFVGATHKVTEGTSYVDSAFAARMNQYHAQGVKVLGSYHVVRTGNLGTQLNFWLSTLDRLVPWWRTFPYWVMQIDAERWPNDNVSAATVTSFASMLVNSDAHGWKVTYASRGQYDNELTGLATDLWNADYRGGPGYPGDNWSEGWSAYSGQTPVLLQYTSTPFDKNAFRGTEAELLALIGGDVANINQNDWDALRWRVDTLLYNREKTIGGPTAGEPNGLHAALASILAQAQANGAGITDLGTRLSALEAKVDQVLTAIADLTAKVDALTPPVSGDLTVTGTLHVSN